jgi:hypothetical protein
MGKEQKVAVWSLIFRDISHGLSSVLWGSHTAVPVACKDDVEFEFSDIFTDKGTASDDAKMGRTDNSSLPESQSPSLIDGINAFFWDYRTAFYQFLATALWYLVGYAYYSQTMEWSFAESVFFGTSTLTTVGFSIYVPESQGSRLFTIFYIIFGMVLEYTIINCCMHALFRAYERKLVGCGKVERVHAITMLIYKVTFGAIGILILCFVGVGGGEYIFFIFSFPRSVLTLFVLGLILL